MKWKVPATVTEVYRTQKTHNAFTAMVLVMILVSSVPVYCVVSAVLHHSKQDANFAKSLENGSFLTDLRGLFRKLFQKENFKPYISLSAYL